MPILDRALRMYAAAREALAPGQPTATAAPTASSMPRGVAELLHRLVGSANSPPVSPAIEAQRLATFHVEPSVRTYLRWTPSDLTSALQQADAGNLRMAADLCEAILGDDRAVAVLNTRVNAVLGSDLTFEAGRGRSKKKAVRALEADEDWYAAWSEAVLGQMLLWGRLLGISPAQQNWQGIDGHGGRLIPVVENWHARHLRQDSLTRAWWMRVGNGGEEAQVSPGDGKWILFMPYGPNRPWAHGLWRGFARLWLLKQYAIDDWGKHSEAHGNPMKLGIPPKVGEANHGNKKLRQELADDLAQLGANSSLVLPPGFDFKLVEATANTWEMFKAQIDMANNAMSVMAIGTNLPTEVGNGAATGATAQNLVRLDYKKADAEALSTMAHDQNLVWWAEFNFGDAGLAPWPVWDVVPPADQKARADVLSTFASALDKLTEANVPVDIPKLAEEFEVPLREVAESRVQSPRIFEYHLKYGILKKNEIRQSLGYDPESGGDVIPEPIVQVPGTKPTAQRPEEENAAASVAHLASLAEAHNAAHDDQRRQTTVETLRAVWGRGAALATGVDRDAWAMGRVEAFLHLLAMGEPEHPTYVADNDLLPDGHERRTTDA
jgi:phage gp29-like protein